MEHGHTKQLYGTILGNTHLLFKRNWPVILTKRLIIQRQVPDMLIKKHQSPMALFWLGSLQVTTLGWQIGVRPMGVSQP